MEVEPLPSSLDGSLSYLPLPWWVMMLNYYYYYYCYYYYDTKYDHRQSQEVLTNVWWMSKILWRQQRSAMTDSNVSGTWPSNELCIYT